MNEQKVLIPVSCRIATSCLWEYNIVRLHFLNAILRAIQGDDAVFQINQQKPKYQYVRSFSNYVSFLKNIKMCNTACTAYQNLPIVTCMIQATMDRF